MSCIQVAGRVNSNVFGMNIEIIFRRFPHFFPLHPLPTSAASALSHPTTLFFLFFSSLKGADLFGSKRPPDYYRCVCRWFVGERTND